MNKRMIPEEFASFEEIQEFWDTHSTADCWDDMRDVALQLSPSLQATLEAKKLYHLLKPAVESFRQGWKEALSGDTLPIESLWSEASEEQ